MNQFFIVLEQQLSFDGYISTQSVILITDWQHEADTVAFNLNAKDTMNYYKVLTWDKPTPGPAP